jgi:hypothetical protein
MFSNLQSFFNYIGGKSESSNNSIKSILTKKGIQFSEIQSGINVNFNDTYDVIFPTNIKESNYIHVKRDLKNKDGECIKCIYLYKLKNNKLTFVNRIKIINIDNIKVDEEDARIDNKLINVIEGIINDINTTETHRGGSETASSTITKTDVKDLKLLEYKSKYNNLKKIMEASISDSDS